MDRNGQYFDHVSGGNLPDPQKPVKGSGGGLFLAGLISGLAGALLILAVVYLGVNFQDMMEDLGDRHTEMKAWLMNYYSKNHTKEDIFADFDL